MEDLSEPDHPTAEQLIEELDTRHRAMGAEITELLKRVNELHILRWQDRDQIRRLRQPDEFEPTDEVHEP